MEFHENSDAYGMCCIYDMYSSVEKCTIIKKNHFSDYHCNFGTIVVRFQKYIRTPTVEIYEDVKNKYMPIKNAESTYWAIYLNNDKSHLEKAEDELKIARENFDIRLITRFFATDGPHYIGLVEFSHNSCTGTYESIFENKYGNNAFLIPWYDRINWRYLMLEEEFYQQCRTLSLGEYYDRNVEDVFIHMYETKNYSPIIF